MWISCVYLYIVRNVVSINEMESEAGKNEKTLLAIGATESISFADVSSVVFVRLNSFTIWLSRKTADWACL